MKVVLHAGAHATDEGRLNACLLENSELLSGHGTEVPEPKDYQNLIRGVLHNALETGISENTHEVLLDAILKGDAPKRLVLTNQQFFGTPKMAGYGGVLYNTAETRLGFYQKMFAGCEIELFMGLCNPATFLPLILSKTRFATMDSFLRGNSPFDIRWSDLIIRMRDAAPNVGITIWCNEDTPLIWGRVMREMAGLKPGQPLKGEYAMMQQIMQPEGMQRFEDHLAERPDMSEAQKCHVAAVFLEKYADEDALHHEIDVPGWDHEMVDRMTQIYDEDLAVIARIPGINLILP